MFRTATVDSGAFETDPHKYHTQDVVGVNKKAQQAQNDQDSKQVTVFVGLCYEVPKLRVIQEWCPLAVLSQHLTVIIVHKMQAFSSHLPSDLPQSATCTATVPFSCS